MRALFTHRTLCWQLMRRDLQERYWGTVLGRAWLVLQPLGMLLVYTWVFGVLLPVRSSAAMPAPWTFASYVLVGLTVFNALAEVMTRSVGGVIERREWLLNSPLPAVLLPLIPVTTSLVLEAVSVVLLVLWLAFSQQLHIQALWLYPAWLMIRLLISLALAYVFAILGVFLRDLRQLLPPVLNVLLLTSAIVYPLEVVPQAWQAWFVWNPLTQLVQGYREALLNGQWLGETYAVLFCISLILAGSAVWLFQRLMPRARYVL